MEKHEATTMERVKPLMQSSIYVGKGYKGLFRCPMCGKETWQHLNFLAGRKMICDGNKISKGG